MSCATSNKSAAILVRERLLKSHKLTGVFSMPDDLFHPVGVITCIMVFEAHSPHPATYKTFFGYFKDDGFRKTKNIGRVNKGDWSAEAYMETDYQKIGRADFERLVRDYAVYTLLNAKTLTGVEAS